jgi:hypothetical protein
MLLADDPAPARNDDGPRGGGGGGVDDVAPPRAVVRGSSLEGDALVLVSTTTTPGETLS